MDRSSRGCRAARRMGSCLAIAVLVSGALAVLGPSAGANTNPACKVTNLATHGVYNGSGTNLQTAIDAANPGVTLQVQGVCTGTFSISHDITLKGKVSKPYPKRATLDGDALGSVVTVNAGTVWLVNLKITNGSGTNVGQSFGGGIYNSGTLNLSGSTIVTGNTVSFEGGGIYNAGALTLRKGSEVSGNYATKVGGGIFSIGAVTMNGHATVATNTAPQGGGGIYSYVDSSLVMNGLSSVRGNEQGGISFQGTLFTMNDGASVTGNTTTFDGGGIQVFSTYALTMNDSSSVSGNRAEGEGGGILNFGSVTLQGSSSISGNRADFNDDTVGTGGGIFNGGSLSGAVDGGNVNDNFLGSVGTTENNIAP